jgi:hypothetical protein
MGFKPLPSINHGKPSKSGHLKGDPESKHIKAGFPRYAHRTPHSGAK